MDVSDNHAKRHSENEFSRKLLTLIDAGAGVIHVRTNEVLRAVTCIRKTIIADRGTYSEWDIVNGTRKFTSANYTDEALPGDNQSDIGAAFQEPLGIIRDKTLDENIRCFTYVNPHVFVENNPHMAQLMLMYNEFLPSSGACVIMVTPDAPLPDNAANNSILCLHFDPPGHTELRQSLDTLLDNAEEDYPEGVNLEDEDRDLVCNIGAGMTRLQFETHVSLATCKATTEDKADSLEASVVAREVQIGKTEIVNSSDILELYESADIDSVGGMENLKEWIDKRKNCYSDEAREFGVEPPKGMVLVGPPGTGKSLAGKATSSVLGVPLVRLDFGRVFSSYVGSSEARVRTALRMVESMAPVVLFCVDGKTEVTLADGTTERIEDMYAAVTHGASYTLRGVSPETGERIDLPMRTIIRTQGKPMVRITSESGREIEVTHDHRLLVNVEGVSVWKAAEDLTEGDDLVEVS